MLSTVLIIDKRKELSTKYKKSIETPEVTPIIASTLKDAFVLLQTIEPDMIIVSDSIEEALPVFCQKIRALTYNTRPIIVALSKSAETDDRISILESGADDFISEPVNIDEFKTRIKAHLRRDIELNLDNKTLLPNQKYVRKSLKRVLSSENQSVLMIGLENLQKYKALYSEVAADKILQTFVAIAKSALDESDFIGQYDETNFIIITNKYNLEKLASFLTFAFDTVAPKFYSETDSKRGYMLLQGDNMAGERINFVSILIGGILDGFNVIPTTNALIEKLLDLKNLAKIPYGSNYIIDRIKLTGIDSTDNGYLNKKIYIKEKDGSLYYLIRTTLELQGYDIVDSIDYNSVYQPFLIILDAGENLAELELIKEIKTIKNFVNTKIIVTTTIHDKTAVLNYGADLYLPKPYEISDLIKWVEYFS